MRGQYTPSYINKLTILYLLYHSPIILSEFQIIRALRDLDLLSYFDLMQYLYESEIDGLIESAHTLNGVKYQLTDRGISAAKELEKEVDLTVREKIDKYLALIRDDLENESQFTGEYIKIAKNEYKIVLRILEKDTVLFELNFTAVSLGEAQSAVKNWPSSAVHLYKNTIDLLLSKNEESNNLEGK